MTNFHRPAVAALAAILIGAVVHGAQGAAKPAFDSGRAYEHLTHIVSFGPRPPGSPALESTRKYIREELGKLKVQVRDQAFDAATPVGKIRMVNLIATIPGRRPERIIFGGHYDTKLYREFRFVGANDAGSSTAFLLELARVLVNRQNPFTVEIVFFDGEEALRPEWAGTDHTYGSRHYVESARSDKTLKTIAAMILVDMIADRDLNIYRESASTPWLTDLVWSAAKRLGLQTYFLDQSTPIEDDHVAFLDAGVPAVNIIDLDYRPWHTSGDTLDKVSARSMQAVGDVLLEALPAIEKRLAAPAGRD
ncbi:MAG: M28 family peptidase [Acidobacteria bacterium]|nr:MAG: M28 family peptidase [Acidobacteriota bacterium]